MTRALFNLATSLALVGAGAAVKTWRDRALFNLGALGTLHGPDCVAGCCGPCCAAAGPPIQASTAAEELRAAGLFEPLTFKYASPVFVKVPPPVTFEPVRAQAPSRVLV